MINYYTELKLFPDLSVEEIKSELLRLEQVWRKREINSPETATAKLALINEAKKVFASSSSKAAYDRELENSKRKPVASDPQRELYAQWKKWYDTALSYLKTEQYDLAKTAIEKAILYSNPDTDDAKFFQDVARIYRETKDYSTALSYINKALVIDETHSIFYITKGLIFSAQYEDTNFYYNNRSALIDIEREMYATAIKKAQIEKDDSLIALSCSLLAFSYCREIRKQEYDLTLQPESDLEIHIRKLATKSLEFGDLWGLGQDAMNLLDQIATGREDHLRRIREQKEQEKRNKAKLEAAARRSVFAIIEEKSCAIREAKNDRDRVIAYLEEYDCSERARQYALTIFQQLKQELEKQIGNGLAGGILYFDACFNPENREKIRDDIFAAFRGKDYHEINNEIEQFGLYINEYLIYVKAILFQLKMNASDNNSKCFNYTYIPTKWGMIFMNELIRLCRNENISSDFVIPIHPTNNAFVPRMIGEHVDSKEHHRWNLKAHEIFQPYYMPCIRYELNEYALKYARQNSVQLNYLSVQRRPNSARSME